MDDPTPQDPTIDPTEPVAVVDDTETPDAPASEAAPRKRRFRNRATGALVAAGLVGALVGGGAVALAGGVGDNGDSRQGWEHHDDADRGRDGREHGPWGDRDGRSSGPGGRMGGGWQQQGGPSQFGPQESGPEQFGPSQGGPQGGGWQSQGGWGPQGMTRGS